MALFNPWRATPCAFLRSLSAITRFENVKLVVDDRKLYEFYRSLAASLSRFQANKIHLSLLRRATDSFANNVTSIKV